MEGTRSVTFDRASDYYDRTRALTAGAMAALLAQAVDELAEREQVLDVGAGTGRFTMPLAAAGVRLVGVDISRLMLDQIVAKSDGAIPFPIAVADATTLPFTDDSFDAALAVHVLHLIEAWDKAVDEVFRVVRSGGQLLVDPGGWGEGSLKEIYDVFTKATGQPSQFIGMESPQELDGVMTARGATSRVLEPVLDRRSLSYRSIVSMLEDGIYSFTWRVDEPTRKTGVAAVRSYLTSLGLELDDTFVHERTITWRSYALP